MVWILVEAALLLGAIALFVIALEVGYRLGVRRQVNTDEPDKTHANTLHGAVLGLLALLLGFTFAMAVSRYETRKTLMIDQANAIGTAALRGNLLPPPYAERTTALFREYVDSRLTTILDIDAPRVGFVTVSPASLLRLQESLGPQP